jgi:hypothetical protein
VRHPAAGRPPLPDAVVALVVRLAGENPRWGYQRLRRELLELGHAVSATVVRSGLRRRRVPPAPAGPAAALGRVCPPSSPNCSPERLDGAALTITTAGLGATGRGRWSGNGDDTMFSGGWPDGAPGNTSVRRPGGQTSCDPEN